MLPKRLNQVIRNLNESSLSLGVLLPVGITYSLRKGTEIMERAYDNDTLRGINPSNWDSEYIQKGLVYCAGAAYSIKSVLMGLEQDISYVLNGEIEPLTIATLTAVVLGNIGFHLINRDDIRYSSSSSSNT